MISLFISKLTGITSPNRIIIPPNKFPNETAAIPSFIALSPTKSSGRVVIMPSSTPKMKRGIFSIELKNEISELPSQKRRLVAKNSYKYQDIQKHSFYYKTNLSKLHDNYVRRIDYLQTESITSRVLASTLTLYKVY